MNKKENLKVAVIESCVNGTMTIKVVAQRLDFSELYVKQGLRKYIISLALILIEKDVV